MNKKIKTWEMMVEKWIHLWKLKQRKFEQCKMKTMTLSFYLLNILKFDLKEIEDGFKWERPVLKHWTESSGVRCVCVCVFVWLLQDEQGEEMLSPY